MVSRSLAWFGPNQSHESIRAHGLGTLQREAERSAPHQLRENAQSSGYTKQHRVIVHLSHAVILQNTRVQTDDEQSKQNN